MSEARLLHDARAVLGEGLYWSAVEARLYFVDIRQHTVYALQADGSLYRQWQLPDLAGWVIPRSRGGWVAGMRDGFALLQLGDEATLQPIANPHPRQPGMRLNDAKAWRDGSIFAGSMSDSDPAGAHGRLYRLRPDLSWQVVDSGYHICNGPCFSPDGQLMYHTDSFLRTIYRYPLAEDGTPGLREVWKVFSPQEGYPDGMTVDAEGCLWVAHWEGGCVSRFAPDGSLLRRIRLPVALVTNVAFFGERLERLAVSTARDGLSAATLAAQPQAGSVFEIDPQGVRGLAPYAFAG
ncbi:SMP-30/gluconolactonase/LRE family protein [Vogesella facilis]|uniref:Regucalcin n=1 Tax=Vogesella facilis TaxID=1655232 RepID=A0ABV7RGY7_9NEIS